METRVIEALAELGVGEAENVAVCGSGAGSVVWNSRNNLDSVAAKDGITGHFIRGRRRPGYGVRFR